MSSILPFPFAFAFKEHLAGQNSHEVKSEITMWLHAQAAEFYDKNSYPG